MKGRTSFLLHLLEFLSWVKLISKRILAISPYRFFLSIVLSLFAQLAMVVSFFLPLKVVFLLSNDEVPAYFDQIYSFSSINQLIAVLVFFSALSYFLFLAGNRYAEYLSAEGARKVVASISKLTLFQNQDELARRSYLRIGKVCAAILFLMFSLGLFSFFYLSLFFIFTLCSIAALGILQLLFLIRPRLLTKTASSPGPFVLQLYGVFFIVLFGFMVTDLLLWSDVGVYVALVCLLLVRQLLQRLTMASIDGVILHGAKERVNQIFLRDVELPPEPEKLRVGSITSILNADDSRQFAKKVIGKVDNSASPLVISEDLDVGFLQSSIVDVVTLRVTWGSRHFLMKLFESRHQLLADRETELLLNLPSDVTAFGFSNLELSDSRKVHVFEFSKPLELSPGKDFKSLRDAFRLKCFDMSLSDQFLERYSSSHVFVWSRLQSFRYVFKFPIFDGLFSTLTSREFLAEIEVNLKRLPIVLCPQDVTSDSLLVLDGDDVTNMHWERWSLEPVGFGLTEPELASSNLGRLLDRSAIAGVDESLVRLSGLCCLLEQKIKNQKFLSARSVVSTMIDTLDVISRDQVDCT